MIRIKILQQLFWQLSLLTFAGFVSYMWGRHGTIILFRSSAPRPNMNLLKFQLFISKAIRYSRKESNRQQLRYVFQMVNSDIIKDAYSRDKERITVKKLPLSHLIEPLITFINYVDDCFSVHKLIENLKREHQKLPLIIISKEKIICSITNENKVTLVSGELSVKLLWDILKMVQTEYVLIGRNVIELESKKKMKKLIQLIEVFGFHYAAGVWNSTKTPYSSYGCYQMNMKLYHLLVYPGFNIAYRSCVLCDYSSAPFVTKTRFILNFLPKLLASKSQDWTIFLEYFIYNYQKNKQVNSLHSNIAVCPDNVFDSVGQTLNQPENGEITKSQLLPIASTFELNRISIVKLPNLTESNKVTPELKEFNFICSEVNMRCTKQIGLSVPLCCLSELSKSLKYMQSILENKEKSIYEVIEGTVFGAIKFDHLLPWERDGDSNFWAYHMNRLDRNLKEITQMGYKMTLDWECPYKYNWEKCRHSGYHGASYYAFHTPNWRTEMYGVTYLLSSFRGNLTYQTRIKLDGSWFVTYTNPALYIRNLYDGEIFQHKEHAASMGKNLDYYLTNNVPFIKCPRPNFHACLDQFYSDGNRHIKKILYSSHFL